MSIFSNPKHEIEKWFKSFKSKIEASIKKLAHQLEGHLKKVAHDAEGQIESTAHDVEAHLHEVGDDIADGLAKGFGGLVALVEQGILGEALEEIEKYALKEVFEGDAPIPLETAFIDIEITDAKLLARTIRQMINEGLPSTNAEWRRIIIQLAPKAIRIKAGLPLVMQLCKRIPLEQLEEVAIDKLLREAGLN